MSSTISLSKIAQFNEKKVRICGWVRRHRCKGKLQFLTIRDGTGELQAILSKADMEEEQFKAATYLTQESSIELAGRVRADSRAPGGYELDVSEIRIFQIAEPFPIQPKEHGVGFLMDHRHLWLRSSRQQAILKVRHEIIKACRDFFDDREFVLIDTPIFTPNSCKH